MTVDFRDIEKIQRDAQTQKPDQDKSWANNLPSSGLPAKPGDPFFNPSALKPAGLPALASPANRKVVLVAMRVMAIVLMGAAMWVLGSEVSWLDEATAEILGLTLFGVGMADLVLANVLQKIWARQEAARGASTSSS
jgi:hypothetical protein